MKLFLYRAMLVLSLVNFVGAFPAIFFPQAFPPNAGLGLIFGGWSAFVGAKLMRVLHEREGR